MFPVASSEPLSKYTSPLIPYDDYKPHILRLYGFNYLRALEIDQNSINMNRSKKRYVKSFPSVKIRASGRFQRNYLFNTLKKQKRFSMIQDTNGGCAQFVA